MFAILQVLISTNFIRLLPRWRIRRTRSWVNSLLLCGGIGSRACLGVNTNLLRIYFVKIASGLFEISPLFLRLVCVLLFLIILYSAFLPKLP